MKDVSGLDVGGGAKYIHKEEEHKKLTGAELLVVLESQGRDESGTQSDECPEEGHTDSTVTEIIKISKSLTVLRIISLKSS